MILFSSWAPNRSVKTEWLNKGFICIDFASPQKESFFLSRRPRKQSIFSTNKIGQKDQLHLLVWLSRRETLKSVLCVILVWRIFHLVCRHRLTVTFVWYLRFWLQIGKSISLNLNNLACEGMERFFTNQNWLRSQYVNSAANVPFSALCLPGWLIQQHSPQPVNNPVLLLHVFGLSAMD